MALVCAIDVTRKAITDTLEWLTDCGRIIEYVFLCV